MLFFSSYSMSTQLSGLSKLKRGLCGQLDTGNNLFTLTWPLQLTSRRSLPGTFLIDRPHPFLTLPPKSSPSPFGGPWSRAGWDPHTACPTSGTQPSWPMTEHRLRLRVFCVQHVWNFSKSYFWLLLLGGSRAKDEFMLIHQIAYCISEIGLSHGKSSKPDA